MKESVRIILSNDCIDKKWRTYQDVSLAICVFYIWHGTNKIQDSRPPRSLARLFVHELVA